MKYLKKFNEDIQNEEPLYKPNLLYGTQGAYKAIEMLKKFKLLGLNITMENLKYSGKKLNDSIFYLITISFNFNEVPYSLMWLLTHWMIPKDWRQDIADVVPNERNSNPLQQIELIVAHDSVNIQDIKVDPTRKYSHYLKAVNPNTYQELYTEIINHIENCVNQLTDFVSVGAINRKGNSTKKIPFTNLTKEFISLNREPEYGGIIPDSVIPRIIQCIQTKYTDNLQIYNGIKIHQPEISKKLEESNSSGLDTSTKLGEIGF